MIKGVVFDVQHFCLDDGPGIRTTVFLKGCPLKCVWCHNAEGLSKNPQLYCNFDACVGCKECENVCSQGAHHVGKTKRSVDFAKCVLCGACVEACRHNAVRIAGELRSVTDIIEDVKKDKPFYENSGGGMTLSGGEPLMQGDFSVALAKIAKESGISVCVETSGFGVRETLITLAQHTDLFLYDFKHSDSEKHLRFTGVSNDIILENLSVLSKLQKPVVLRCPIIPNCNDSEEHYQAIAKLANKMENISEIQLEPYHPFGESKYAAIGIEAEYQTGEMMELPKIQHAKDVIQQLTDKTVIIT